MNYCEKCCEVIKNFDEETQKKIYDFLCRYYVNDKTRAVKLVIGKLARANLTLSSLAERLGFDTDTLLRKLQGDEEFTTVECMQIMRALKLSVDEGEEFINCVCDIHSHIKK